MTTEQRSVESYFAGADLISLMSDRVRQLDTELAEMLAKTGGFRRDMGFVDHLQSILTKTHNELIAQHNATAECLHLAGCLIAAMKIVDDVRATQLATLKDDARVIHRQSEKIRMLEAEVTRLASDLEKAKKASPAPVPAKT